MKKIILAAAAVATLAYADCTYTKSSDVTVGWTAFKTPMKIGVGGAFKSVEYTGANKGISLTQLLKGAKVSIKTSGVDSGDAGRDAKLVSFFFDQMKGKTLGAQIVDLDETMNVVLVRIEMNGKSVNVPMKYTYEKGLFNAKGYLDLGDFNALGALGALTKACWDRHQGKTWQDVDVGFALKIEEQCGK
jgi:hypothetical protein